ncbi:MAG TPA: LytTR family DNA-binding domain-containing protein [Bacteroidales bacterium]|nr:LytTR family DNA-binding domain-containing protein [Bacteroidales bacterium]
MTIRCAIIDDEHLARQYMKDYVSRIPFLELEGEYNSPMKIMDALHQGSIDLLFLDIQMPEISGLDFLRSLERKPYVVLTTAYKEFALEGYELEVTDYLLKPFSFDRFLKAANRVYQTMSRSTQPGSAGIKQEQKTDFKEDYLVIRADRKLYKINYEDLIYIEGQKAYVTFHSENNKRITALASLKELEEKLPAGQFIRIHKSYIVSVKKIDALEGNQLEVAGKMLPVGKNYRSAVARVFGLEE